MSSFNTDTKCLMYSTSQSSAVILSRKCCLCGAPIQGNGANMCIDCIKNTIDLNEGIETDLNVTFCKNCGRYLSASKQWIPCERESGELLGLMLKLAKGFKKLEIVDANFIWTEPHSRRIIIRVTFKKSILNGTIVQSTVDLKYKECPSMCPDCNNVTRNYTWEACVQLRQKVDHKRTLLNLEQVILKKNLHKNASDVDLGSGGLDFYFGKKGEAINFMNNIKSICIMESIRSSRQVVSQDTHNNIYKNRYTYIMEIPKICKDDICVLPKSLYSGSNNILLCTRVSSLLKFIDPTTMNMVDVSSTSFSKHPFDVLLTSSDLREYNVIDIEECSEQPNPKYKFVEVTIIKDSDFGVTDDFITVYSHLGNIIDIGDIVLGYDIKSYNFSSEVEQSFHADYVPDVILVKKKEEKHPKKMKFTKINKHVKEEKGSAKRAIEKYEQDRDMLYEYDMENDFENLPEHFNVEEVTEAPDLDFDSNEEETN